MQANLLESSIGKDTWFLLREWLIFRALPRVQQAVNRLWGRRCSQGHLGRWRTKPADGIADGFTDGNGQHIYFDDLTYTWSQNE